MAKAVRDMQAERRQFPELPGKRKCVVSDLERANVLLLLTTQPFSWVEQEIETATAGGIPILSWPRSRFVPCEVHNGPRLPQVAAW